MKILICLSLLFLGVCGCMQTHSDDLRGVPVTNNPNLIPQNAQTAQGAPF